MKLRLIEQLTDCSRCKAEADSRCVLVSAAGTLAESACHQQHVLAPARDLPLQRSRCMERRLIEQACGCFTVQVGGGLKVYANLCRTPLAGEMLVFAFAAQPP